MKINLSKQSNSQVIHLLCLYSGILHWVLRLIQEYICLISFAL